MRHLLPTCAECICAALSNYVLGLRKKQGETIAATAPIVRRK